MSTDSNTMGIAKVVIMLSYWIFQNYHVEPTLKQNHPLKNRLKEMREFVSIVSDDQDTNRTVNFQIEHGNEKFNDLFSENDK